MYISDWWPIRIRHLWKDSGDINVADRYRIEVLIGWRSIPLSGFWFTRRGWK
jgi:hypothetical protein